MAKMQITKGHTDDWPSLFSMDASSNSDYSYKVEISRNNDAYSLDLSRFKLPRTMGLSYPRDKAALLNQLSTAEMVLIGKIQNEAIAFACLDGRVYPDTVQVTDLVVNENARLNGIGTILLGAAEKWALERNLHRLFMAVPLRNDPMVSLVKKLRYSFCGFMASYFRTGDDALFFEKRIG